jgi:hypothetical protein
LVAVKLPIWLQDADAVSVWRNKDTNFEDLLDVKASQANETSSPHFIGQHPLETRLSKLFAR